jgi:hypothetical protein
MGLNVVRARLTPDFSELVKAFFQGSLFFLVRTVGDGAIAKGKSSQNQTFNTFEEPWRAREAITGEVARKTFDTPIGMRSNGG